MSSLLELAKDQYHAGDFKSAVDILLSEKDLSKDHYAVLADAYLELGELKKAKKAYLKAEKLTQAIFTLILDDKFAEAKALIKKSSFSIGAKWNLFLCEFLGVNELESISHPGFLTFRIFFEATISYLISFGKEDHVQKFLDNEEEIKMVYPELVKHIGMAYLGNGKIDTAIDVLTYAAKTSQDCEIYFKRGRAYMQRGDNNLARLDFEKTLSLLPGHRASLYCLQELSA